MIEQEEPVDSLPQNWVRVPLRIVGEIAAGYGFPKKLQGKREGDLPFFKVSDLSNSFLERQIYLRKAANHVSLEDCRDLHAKPLKQGTIVFPKIGEAIRLNRRAILAQPSLVDNNVMGIYTSPEVVCDLYAFYYFLTLKLENYSRATTVPSLRKTDIEQIRIPVPPLAEQKRIVVKIEELFGWLDAGVEGLKRIKAQLKRYRQAVLKYAFEGKLTEEWRKADGQEIEPASMLLEHIKEVGKQESVPTYKELQRVDQPRLPKLPTNWTWVRLGEICDKVEKVNPRVDSSKEFIYLEIASIDNSLQRITRPEKHSGKDAPSRARQLVRTGDVLFSTVRTYLRNIAPVDEIYDGQIASTGFCVIRPIKPISSRLLFHIVQADGFLNPLNEIQRGTSYPAVRDSDVFAQILPLPPLLEQHKIVEEIESRISIADEVRKVVDTALRQAEHLRHTILKRAFEGKLVPQDPSEEPAARLLERIREERSTSKNQGKRQGKWMSKKGMLNSWG